MAKDVIDRVEWLEACLEQTQQQIQAQQHLLTWMLARLPERDVQNFLEQWGNECLGNPQLGEDVALISALYEDLPQQRAGCASAKDRSR